MDNKKRKSRALAKSIRNRRNKRLRKSLARALSANCSIHDYVDVNVTDKHTHKHVQTSTPSSPIASRFSPESLVEPPSSPPKTPVSSPDNHYSPSRTLTPPSPSPQNLPSPPRSPSPVPSQYSTIILGDSPLSSPLPSESSGFDRNYDWDEPTDDFESRNNFSESETFELEEELDPYSLLNQFPPFTHPILENTFTIGPGPVNHQELHTILIESPPHTIVPCYIPNRFLPVAVSIEVLWRKFPPSTIHLEEIP